MDAGEASVVLEEISYFEAVLRMLCAMLVGIVVGVERGRNHRPAGMRTHMLVALGACVTMVVSNYLFVEFRSLGATRLVWVHRSYPAWASWVQVRSCAKVCQLKV